MREIMKADYFPLLILLSFDLFWPALSPIPHWLGIQTSDSLISFLSLTLFTINSSKLIIFRCTENSHTLSSLDSLCWQMLHLWFGFTCFSFHGITLSFFHFFFLSLHQFILPNLFSAILLLCVLPLSKIIHLPCIKHKVFVSVFRQNSLIYPIS
jgi:hypothetical protein